MRWLRRLFCRHSVTTVTVFCGDYSSPSVWTFEKRCGGCDKRLRPTYGDMLSVKPNVWVAAKQPTWPKDGDAWYEILDAVKAYHDTAPKPLPPDTGSWTADDYLRAAGLK